MWKSNQKSLNWPNWITGYFLKVSLSFQLQSQHKLLRLGIWHSQREVLTSLRGRVALDCTRSSWDCCSLGLLQETGKKQMLGMQHLAVLADSELGRQWKATPVRESVLPSGEAASQLPPSSAHWHHSLSKVENSVLWLRQLVSKQLLGISSSFPDTFSLHKPWCVHPWKKRLHIMAYHLTIWNWQVDRKKFAVNWCLIKLKTHLLWVARSSHFSQSSSSNKSKRTWEDLYPTSPRGKQEVSLLKHITKH